MANEIEILGPGKQNPAAAYIRSLPSVTSRETQTAALNIIARKLLKIESAAPRGRPLKAVGKPPDDAFMFDWASLRNEHVSAIQAWLVKEYSPATARRFISAVKGTLRFARRLHQISPSDYLEAVDVDFIKGVSKSGRMLHPEEVAALLATCGKGAPVRATRDLAMLTIMLLYTARRAEVAAIDMADYLPKYKPGVARLVLHGKGRKDREQYPQNGEREIIEDWLKLRGSEPGPMFKVINKADQIVNRRVSPISIYVTVVERMKAAKITGASPHDLRRTAISNLLDVTDAATVAKMAGHSSFSTTMLYDKRGEQNMIDALSKLHLPFRKQHPLKEA